MKKIIAITAGVVSLAAAGCGQNDADVASKNLSKSADNFEVERHIVFFNGITDKYLLEIRGLCSLGNQDTPGRLSVTCKTPEGFKKHFLGLSDNVSYFVEQGRAKNVSTSRYRVVFKPSTLLPDVDLR